MTGTLHEDQYTFLIISRSVFVRMRNVSENYRGNQNTHFMFSNFFSKGVPFMRYCRKILSSGTRHRSQCGACALRAGYLRLQTHSQNSNTCCFSATKIVSRTRLNVTLFVHCLSCLVLVIVNVNAAGHRFDPDIVTLLIMFECFIYLFFRGSTTLLDLGLRCYVPISHSDTIN